MTKTTLTVFLRHGVLVLFKKVFFFYFNSTIYISKNCNTKKQDTDIWAPLFELDGRCDLVLEAKAAWYNVITEAGNNKY